MIQIKFSEIKKKSIRDLLIHMFVIESFGIGSFQTDLGTSSHDPTLHKDVTQKLCGKSIQRIKDIIRFIMLCFNFKIITSKDVVMQDWKIVQIHHLHYQDESLLIEPIEIKTSSRPTKKRGKRCKGIEKKKTFYSLWTKYIDKEKEKLGASTPSLVEDC